MMALVVLMLVRMMHSSCLKSSKAAVGFPTRENEK
jgi:hypothetical protein